MAPASRAGSGFSLLYPIFRNGQSIRCSFDGIGIGDNGMVSLFPSANYIIVDAGEASPVTEADLPQVPKNLFTI
jgi:hypothetical protein